MPMPMMFMPELQPNGAFEWTQATGVRALICGALLPHAPHLFTTRDLELRDNRAEWAAVAGALGVDPARLRVIRQVHGASVAVARRGSEDAWPAPEADVILSDDPQAAVAVRVADCAPVLLADTRLNVVGAVHAGWRGTVQRAAAAAVAALSVHFGSQPQDLIAAIGPCLGPCCGEVGPEVVEAFRGAGHSTDDMRRWFQAGRGDRSMLALSLANADQLSAAGIPRDQIFDAGICTRTHATLFHSYRADGEGAGRMVGLIKLRTQN